MGQDETRWFDYRTNKQIKEPEFHESDYKSVAHVCGARLRGGHYQRLRRAMETAQQTDHLLRLRDVAEKTGLSRSTIYRMIEAERFPRPYRVGDFAVRWKSSSIDLWIGALNRG